MQVLTTAPPSPHRYGADSADEILELLHRGNMHRAVEPTAANQVSSRSHAVLQITVEQSERTAHVTGNVRSTR